MGNRDSRGESLVFDDRTQLNQEDTTDPPDAPDAPDHATVIDEALDERVAGRLRTLRREMELRSRRAEEDAEKTAFAEAPCFDDDDSPGTSETRPMRIADELPLGGEKTPGDDFEMGPATEPVPPDDHNAEETAVDLSSEQVDALLKPQRSYVESPMEDRSADTLEEEGFGRLQADAYTVRAAAPLEEPELPPPIDREANAEYTRKEPIPYELFFGSAGPEVEDVPPSVRPPPPRIRKSKPAESSDDSFPDTMLNVAAFAGVAPEPAPLGEPDEEVAADQPEPKVPLPDEGDEDVGLEIEALLDAEPPRPAPRDGVGTEDLRRLADVSSATAKVIPMVLAVFVVVATLVIAINLFQASSPPTSRHVELRFLATHRGKQTQVLTSEDAPTARINIETIPPDILVVHSRQILGKTPITVDLPINLGEEIGVELSGPYYETWVSQIHRDGATDEYKIKAELIAK